MHPNTQTDALRVIVQTRNSVAESTDVMSFPKDSPQARLLQVAKNSVNKTDALLVLADNSQHKGNSVIGTHLTNALNTIRHGKDIVDVLTLLLPVQSPVRPICQNTSQS